MKPPPRAGLLDQSFRRSRAAFHQSPVWYRSFTRSRKTQRHTENESMKTTPPLRENPLMTTLIRKHASKFFCSLFGLVALGFSPVEMQRPPSRSLPVPLPIAPVPDPISPPATDLGPSATFTFADATQIKAQAYGSGVFQLVGLHPREVVEIGLDAPVSLGSNPIAMQPLDGGKIMAASKGSRRGLGLSSIRFQVGNQPGLYRVLVSGNGSRSLLQFWVADARNPKNNRPVLNPGH
jgi:hypothetical protein